MSTFTYHKPGIGNASSYIVSGTPWYTSSLAPALSTTSTVINLPRVTNSITIKNTSTTGDVLRFTLNDDNIVDNTNYITLEDGESFSAELRVVDVQLISDTETPVPFTILAGLTNIDRTEMYGKVPSAPNLLAWVQKQALLAGPPDENPEFNFLGSGIAMSADSNFLALGAIADGPDFQGSAYIFKNINGSYTQTQRILAQEPYDSGQFGDTLSFSADGNILAIAAWTNTGSVSIYTKDQNDLYQQVQKITTPSPSDNFGYSTLLNSSGDKLIVGADQDTDNGALAGAVYIYDSGSSGFQQVQKLTASGDLNPAGDRFGEAIAADSSGDILAVGAYNDEENGSGAGSVYIFQSSSIGYQQVEKLLVSGDPSTIGDNFGSSLSFNSAGTILAVGSPKDDITGTDDGSVYIFQSSSIGYQQVQKLTASGDADPAGDRFGSSVSLNSAGDILAVGAPSDEENGSSSAGSVYIFQSSSVGYQQIKKLTSQELDPAGENLGADVSLNSAGDVLLAGAAFNSDQAFFAGAAYIFKYTRDY